MNLHKHTLTLTALFLCASCGSNDTASTDSEKQELLCELPKESELQDCEITELLRGGINQITSNQDLMKLCDTKCTIIKENFVIRGVNTKNLKMLKNIKKFDIRTMSIARTGLESLEGLENAEWTFTEGMAKGAGYDVIIENNNSLKSLRGLEGLVSTGGIGISKNPKLEDFSALNNIVYSQGIQIVENGPTRSFDGLNKLKEIEDYASGDETRPGLLVLSGFPELEEITGFKNLKSVGDLRIGNNRKLKRVSSFRTLNPNIRRLFVVANTQFSQCDIDDLKAYLKPERTTIMDNKECP